MFFTKADVDLREGEGGCQDCVGQKYPQLLMIEHSKRQMLYVRSLVTVIYYIRNKLRSAPLRLSEEQEGLMVTKHLCVMKNGQRKVQKHNISYFNNLPSKHHFLATLFSKILLLS